MADTDTPKALTLTAEEEAIWRRDTTRLALQHRDHRYITTLDAARADLAALRQALIACINNGTDGRVSPDVSLAFLLHAPEECAAIKSQRDSARAEAERLRKERDAQDTAFDSLRQRHVAARARIKALEEALERIAHSKGDSISGHLPAAECRRIAASLLTPVEAPSDVHPQGE